MNQQTMTPCLPSVMTFLGGVVFNVCNDHSRRVGDIILGAMEAIRWLVVFDIYFSVSVHFCLDGRSLFSW